MSRLEKLNPKWPVAEVFGPTIQGEGVDQGVAAHFVRFGGCDFKCSWCDTPHAVLPQEVRKLPRLGANEIIGKLEELEATDAVPWIVLTGGNPALHDLSSLVEALQESGWLVAVETQGSRWRDWMKDVDRLCVSPKPPSSGQRYDWTSVQRFMDEGLRARALGERDYEWLFLKVVVFDETDLEWAKGVRNQLSDAILYLSAGNDAGRTVGNPDRVDERTTTEVREDLLEHGKWLTETVLHHYPDLCHENVVMQTQQHVLLWGNEIGR